MYVFCSEGSMVTEGEPTNVVKVLHLLVLSFSWGMQVWVSFIAGTSNKKTFIKILRIYFQRSVLCSIAVKKIYVSEPNRKFSFSLFKIGHSRTSIDIR